MDSIRRGLRENAVEKDMYERLLCANCEEQLVTENDPEDIGSIRACPECGSKWRQLP